MDTAGESPVKRVKKTHRGWRSSAGQKKRDQRNEKYCPGAFAFAWLAHNYGTASCNVATTSDGGVRSIETERGIVGAGKTLAGSPQDGWAELEERMNRTEASVRGTSQACGSSAARAQGAPGADGGALAARYQPENFNGEDTGWRDWSRVFRTWAGRFQRGQVQESSDQWRHDLEMRLQPLSWILERCCSRLLSRTDSLLQRESVENCPDQQSRRRI